VERGLARLPKSAASNPTTRQDMDFRTFSFYAIAFLKSSDPERAAQFDTLRGGDDLLASGLVDSHVFINLCLALEEKTGVIIDLGELDPEQFSSLNGLYAVVTAKAA
jgi:acyl carrier protein